MQRFDAGAVIDGFELVEKLPSGGMADGVPRLFRTLAIGVCRAAAEPVRRRIGMADHNQDASRHGLLPGSLALQRQGRSTLAT